jgi:hypothetical protein
VNLPRWDDLSDDEKLIMEATYDAFQNSGSPEEALKIIAFSATGTQDVTLAITNLSANLSEKTVRLGLAGILLGLMDAGRADVTLKYMIELSNIESESQNRG